MYLFLVLSSYSNLPAQARLTVSPSPEGPASPALSEAVFLPALRLCGFAGKANIPTHILTPNIYHFLVYFNKRYPMIGYVLEYSYYFSSIICG